MLILVFQPIFSARITMRFGMFTSHYLNYIFIIKFIMYEALITFILNLFPHNLHLVG